MSKEEYWFNSQYQFINPYHFVEINQNSCDRRNYTDSESKLLSGSLTCELITKTPLIIPDPSEKHDLTGDKHYYYPFMKINGRYTIPGSSLRGPVRSVYETLTNSCISTARNKIYLSQRTNVAFKPGLLERDSDGNWTLFEAVRYLVPTEPVPGHHITWYSPDALLKDYGHWGKVEFNYAKVKVNGTDKSIVTEIKKSGGSVTGYLKVGEHFSKKKYESIFVEKSAVCNDQDKIDLAYTFFANTINAYRDSAINRNLKEYKEDGTVEGDHDGYQEYPLQLKDADQDIIPIWYQDHGEYYYLSPANIGRFTFKNIEKDLVKPLDPCVNREDLCKACALFGMVSEEGEGNGYSSRVRFSDAFPVGDIRKPEPCELKELASPHVSYLPFYAKYSIKNSLYYVKNYDEDGAGFRGRKYYWHHNPDPKYYKNNEKKNKRNACMELLGGSGDKKARFRFTVWFDRISEEQLCDLIWTLTLGENDENSNLCYKIGHGKPFGFGSCKIVITDAKQRIVNIKDSEYQEEPLVIDSYLNKWKEQNLQIIESKSYKQMMKLLDFSTIKGTVQYPSVVEGENHKELKKNSLASHQWFSRNYKFGAKNPDYVLPEIPLENNVNVGKAISLPKAVFGQPTVLTFDSSSNEEEENRTADPDAEKAVLITKEFIPDSEKKRFKKQIGRDVVIEEKDDYFERADVDQLADQYSILLVSSSKRDRRIDRKISEAKAKFKEVWSFDQKTGKWEKK